jgi:conjugative relaxase-like TrwC/TraI family protein
MLTIRAMADGRGYSARHLQHSDYYAEGERVVGRWMGRAAEMLGLKGTVQDKDFEALRQGLDPGTGGFMRQRQGSDRIGPDGASQSKARHLYDFTFSAPKSVSVMAVLGGDERLRTAHTDAVAVALAELEDYAAARVRQGGANADRRTGNVALAVYEHDTSRELDPQLHTHAVAANLTFDGVEARWKALQASGIYERRAYLTEVYRNALAAQVLRLGYEIDSRRDHRGRDNGFEIRGVSGELLSRFSQRSRQRDNAIRAFVEKTGRQPTDNEVAVLVRETRADKLIEMSTEEVRRQQRSRVTDEEATGLSEVRRDRAEMDLIPVSAEPSLLHGQEHVFERVSVARDYELLTEALRHGRGRIRLEGLKGRLADQESAGQLLRHNGEVATTESLQRERKMIEAVNRDQGCFASLGNGREFIASDKLRPEQKKAVEFVLGSRDRAVAISGAAGTGKTATLQELRRGLVEGGRDLIAVAPTMSAVAELKAVGFTEAISVERLLQDPRSQALLADAVIIVDEAGMVSGRQMAELIGLAERSAARVVFTGDTHQIQSVEAGDALRVLETESRLKSVSLREVQRQTDRSYRRAIEELRRDPESGFRQLEAIGAVREIGWNDRATAVADAWDRALAGEGRSALVVCGTHDEIARVTDAIRENRRKAGHLQDAHLLERDVALGWTTAQKCDWRNYRPGQLLNFHRSVKGIERNTTMEVIRAEDRGVVVRDSNGADRLLTRKQVRSFEVFERSEFEVSAGDQLLLTANRRQTGFHATNGEIVTVNHVNENGRICLDDGRVVPRDYTHLAHGYAVTAHRSQGKTVDEVIVSADGMSRELFYVAASRGRDRITVVTSDADALRESVGRSGARQSGTELARKAVVRLDRGIRRGFEAACGLVMHAKIHRPIPNYAVSRHLPERRHREHGIGR